MITVIETTEMVVTLKDLIKLQGNRLIVKRAADDVTAADTWNCVGGKIGFSKDILPMLLLRFLLSIVFCYWIESIVQ